VKEQGDEYVVGDDYVLQIAMILQAISVMIRMAGSRHTNRGALDEEWPLDMMG
jgi:hypothetical protein